MYIAMNRFRIAPGHEEDFERLWRERDSQIANEPGFESFHLLKGASDGEGTLYASHTVWASEDDFRAWTKSESFKKVHQQARAPQGTYLGHPVFEGFEAILS
ncbi:MAG: antibiotic biosynthesis monooxygenase [Myxococcota bacterium]